MLDRVVYSGLFQQFFLKLLFLFGDLIVLYQIIEIFKISFILQIA